MGMTDITLTVISHRDPTKKSRVNFLVDSGASYTSLPAQVVKELDIKPKFEETFSLADASTIKRKIGNALVRWRGREVATPVILGERGDSALLGAITLESLGVVLDPLKRQLRPADLRMQGGDINVFYLRLRR